MAGVAEHLLKQGGNAMPEEDHRWGRQSTELTSMEILGIEAAMSAVQEKGLQLREDEGLSKVSFFLGVMNVPIYCLVLAWYPAYLWILYGAQLFVLLPAWFVSVSRVHKGAYFALDFCWVVNGLFALYMACTLFNIVPDGLRLHAFVAFYSVALGPLGWACLLLSNGLVFHSVEKITSLTIHMTPVWVSWTLLFFSDKVESTWPGRFPTPAQLASVSVGDLYLHGFVVYLVWLALHSAWLLSVGVDCPKRGMETVFNDLYVSKGLGPGFTRITGSTSIRKHAALYLCIHLLLVMLSFMWPMLCLKHIYVHTAFGGLIWISAVWNGASYYEYAMAKKYMKVLHGLKAKIETSRKAPTLI